MVLYYTYKDGEADSVPCLSPYELLCFDPQSSPETNATFDSIPVDWALFYYYCFSFV